MTKKQIKNIIRKIVKKEREIVEYFNKLMEEFGKGYDISNLKRMRMLYLCFQKGGTVCHQLSWSHYRTILPIKNENKRNYYIKKSKSKFNRL